LSWLLIIAIGGYLIIWQFMDNFKQLIDIATSVSFLIAPFCAIANHILIFSDDIPIEKQPRKWLKLLSFIGIVFLLVFSIIFTLYS
jgi:Mn2+/Fe2+ NRAMP family transporter